MRKYLGAYVASMGGLDPVVFTGGIGQGSAEVRALALQGLECMGITLASDRSGKSKGPLRLPGAGWVPGPATA